MIAGGVTRIRVGRWRGRLPNVVGCLLAPVILLCVLGLLGLIFGVLRSSDVHQGAMARLRAHPAAVEALGEPIEQGWFWSGSISISGSTGNANFTIPVSGSQGRGSLHVVANKSAEGWHYTTLRLTLKGSGEVIDLLSDRRGGLSNR